MRHARTKRATLRERNPERYAAKMRKKRAAYRANQPEKQRERRRVQRRAYRARKRLEASQDAG
ncbi:hypothetical protein [Micromonospora andamanensis]|uniref:hypothetical protein n=1 Tax=Micromonospora andamanensis TaxID=1287068 RepID=UPI00195168B6|nr:hypothetical protein [Micromonospora andamanensis]